MLSLLPAGKTYVRSKTNSHIETERRRGGSYVAGLGILSVKDFLVSQRTKHVRVFLGLAGYTIGVSCINHSTTDRFGLPCVTKISNT